jgi:hypothetical protein
VSSCRGQKATKPQEDHLRGLGVFLNSLEIINFPLASDICHSDLQASIPVTCSLVVGAKSQAGVETLRL